MPYTPHIRMTALGVLGLGSAVNERFSFSLNIGKTGGAIPTSFLATLFASPDSDYFTDVRDDLVAFFSSAQTGLSNAARLQEVKFANIGADGKYTEDPVILPAVATGGVQEGTNPRALPQAALVVSLATETRGPTGKGRFYLPMPSTIVPAETFQLPSSYVDGVRASAATFLSAVNNTPGIDVQDLNVIVASTKGTNSLVTGVKVGRVVDTMRSRRTSIPENYNAEAAVAS